MHELKSKSGTRYAGPGMDTGGQAMGMAPMPTESAAQSIFTQVREIVEKCGALANRVGSTLVPIMRDERNKAERVPLCPVAAMPPLYTSLRDELISIDSYLDCIQEYIDRCDL